MTLENIKISAIQLGSNYPAGIHLLKVYNKNTRKRCGIYSKLKNKVFIHLGALGLESGLEDQIDVRTCICLLDLWDHTYSREGKESSSNKWKQTCDYFRHPVLWTEIPITDCQQGNLNAKWFNNSIDVKSSRPVVLYKKDILKNLVNSQKNGCNEVLILVKLQARPVTLLNIALHCRCFLSIWRYFSEAIL